MWECQEGWAQDDDLQRGVLVLLSDLFAEGAIVNFDVQKTEEGKENLHV